MIELIVMIYNFINQKVLKFTKYHLTLYLTLKSKSRMAWYILKYFKYYTNKHQFNDWMLIF